VQHAAEHVEGARARGGIGTRCGFWRSQLDQRGGGRRELAATRAILPVHAGLAGEEGWRRCSCARHHPRIEWRHCDLRRRRRRHANGEHVLRPGVRAYVSLGALSQVESGRGVARASCGDGVKQRRCELPAERWDWRGGAGRVSGSTPSGTSSNALIVDAHSAAPKAGQQLSTCVGHVYSASIPHNDASPGESRRSRTSMAQKTASCFP
jgi:hypothetical protein